LQACIVSLLFCFDFNPFRSFFMKYAILGDIHANLEALNAVLADAKQEGANRYVCTGDIVGYNADPKACLQKAKEMEISSVQGNHDYYAAHHDSVESFNPAARHSISWTRKQLGIFDRKYLRQLPMILDIENFTLVHSSLESPNRWNYVHKKREVEMHFRHQFNPVCFFGHTHIPMLFIQKQDHIEHLRFDSIQIEKGAKYLINVGSVGQPRDRDSRACYLLYDLQKEIVQLRRVEYDIKTTQKKIRAAGLPFRNALRLATGR